MNDFPGSYRAKRHRSIFFFLVFREVMHARLMCRKKSPLAFKTEEEKTKNFKHHANDFYCCRES